MAVLPRSTSLSKAINRSLRDPDGQVLDVDGRLIRLVSANASATVRQALSLPCVTGRIADGTFVATTVLDAAVVAQFSPHWRQRDGADGHIPTLALEHRRVPFLSFPGEWPAEMLYEAGRLTLDLATDLLNHGFGLKDATPANVAFIGTQAVFVDVLSLERRTPGDPTWLPFAQFVRMFVLPLLAERHFGLPLQAVFANWRDGLDPQDLYRMAGPLGRLAPSLFSLVTLPVWLTRKSRHGSEHLYQPKITDPAKARFMLGGTLRYLRQALERARPRDRRASTWSSYMEADVYSPVQFKQKEQFVVSALTSCRGQRVLDVGCNAGHFSLLAANTGASVVGLDSDATVAGRAFARARAEGADVLTLVGSLTRPTPGTGWDNRESTPFLSRVEGQFDVVMLLAVLHHMAITDGIPIQEIVRQLAAMTTDSVIIEFVSGRDQSCRILARGRSVSHLTEAAFETAIAAYFDVTARQHLDGTERTMYHLRRINR